MTWEELVTLEPGTLVEEWKTEDGLCCAILRGGGSLCAYIGVPNGHPFIYDYDKVDLWVHGGLTYAGDGEPRPRGYFFYGWDYAHSGDYLMFYDDPAMQHIYNKFKDYHLHERKWGMQDVRDEIFDALADFRLLANKAREFVRSLGTIYNLVVITGLLITVLFSLILFL